MCSKIIIKIPERRHWCHSGVFIVKFETYFTTCFSVSIVNFEQVNAVWDNHYFMAPVNSNFDIFLELGFP